MEFSKRKLGNKRHTNLMEEAEVHQTEFLNSDCMETNSILQHALHYASIGYPVFPLQNVIKVGESIGCSCKLGNECSHIAKHPRTRFGFKEATTDEAIVRGWWGKNPDANIGILTGKESGIFVIDVDVDKGGHYALEELSDYYKNSYNLEGLPATLTTISGSGGKHYYFKYNFDVGGVDSSAGLIGQGIDVRGDNAYIIAPPSLHACGNRYKWFGNNVEILDAPEWLLYEISIGEKKLQGEGKAGEETARIKTKVYQGRRHIELFKYVCGLVNTFSEEQVLEKTYAYCDQYFQPNLKKNEIKNQVKYLYNRYGNRSKNMGLKR